MKIKKNRSSSNKSLPKNPNGQTAHKEPILPKAKNYKPVFGTIAGIFFAVIFISIGWYLGHRNNPYDPYGALNGYRHSRHGFMVKSAEVSIKMTDRAVEALKKKDIKGSIEDCRIAIDIFPINAKPYILLTKLYLMTGQEMKLFDTLTLAGRSYPDFNHIVDVIDNENLDKLPLEGPQGSIFLADFPENKKMAMSFMFDDGEANVYKALPVFEKYGYRATIPVVAGFVSDTSNDPFWGSWAQWTDAANRGFEIANHSMYHRDSKKLQGSDFDIAIDQAKETIEKNINHQVTAYVFPHDSYTDEAVRRALRLHEVIRTSEFLRSTYERTVDIVIGGPHVSVETAKRLVDIAAKRRLWLIAKCHGVTEKRSMRSFKSITPEFLEAYLAYIHSRSDDIWVDTFSHVFEYMSRRAHTRIETKGFTADTLDFVMRQDSPRLNSTIPLTVVIKTTAGMTVKSAQAQDGHTLKAWPCDTDKSCVDVDIFNKNIHVDLKPQA